MNEPTPQMLNQLVAEAVDYVHGKARDDIVSQLSNADDTSETIAAITYKTAEGILSKYKDKGMEAELDLAMGLATEVIDMQMEILERINPNVANTDTQRLREDALLRTITIYAENQEDTPEVQAQAQQMLAGFMEDGSVDGAFDYVNRRAAADGLNVDDMIRKGNTMAVESVGGGKRPVASGVDVSLEGIREEGGAPPLMGFNGPLQEPGTTEGGPPSMSEFAELRRRREALQKPR